MLKCKQPAHDKGTLGSADTLLHNALIQNQLRYLRLVMSRTNILELYINNIILFHMCTITGLSMNGMQSHSHAPTHTSIYLGMLLSHVQNFIWVVSCTPTLQQVCSVILM